MRIVVVDNDSSQSALPVVEDLKSRLNLPISYDMEPMQGISAARNRLLSHVQADYFAFIDDDEVASQEWLESLFKTLEYYKADAVFGPVLSKFPQNAPSWAINAKIFRRSRRPTGIPMVYGGAGNTMVRREALGRPAQKFDLAFDLTGGEDIDFFYRLHLAGKRMLWCDEAIVYEHVTPARLTLKWICQRGFRGGQLYSRIIVSRHPARRKIMRTAAKTIQAAGIMAALPILFLSSRDLFIDQLTDLSAAMGETTAFFTKMQFSEYDSKRYQ